MPEIKRSADNPPLSLQKAVFNLGKSQEWNDAKKEWEMARYFYVSGHITCPCSPRAIHNITVLVNKFNFTELVVCNSCTKRYFEIDNGSQIENSLRRLKSDITLNMNEISLNYLLANRVVDPLEDYNYTKIKGFRNSNKNPFIFEIRKQTNMKLLYFTDYNNKAAFDKIDGVLLWALTHSGIEIRGVARIWKELLRSGKYLENQINEFIENSWIEMTLGDKKNAKKLLDEHIYTSCIFAGGDGWPYAVYRWENAEEYMKNKQKYEYMEFSEIYDELEDLNYQHLKDKCAREEELNNSESEVLTRLGTNTVEQDDEPEYDFLGRNNEKSGVRLFTMPFEDDEEDDLFVADLDDDDDILDREKRTLPMFSDEMLEGLEEDEGNGYEEEEDFSQSVLACIEKSTLLHISSFLFKNLERTYLIMFLEWISDNFTLPRDTKISNDKDLYAFLVDVCWDTFRDGLVDLLGCFDELKSRYLMEQLNQILKEDDIKIIEDEYGKIRIRSTDLLGLSKILCKWKTDRI